MRFSIGQRPMTREEQRIAWEDYVRQEEEWRPLFIVLPQVVAHDKGKQVWAFLQTVERRGKYYEGVVDSCGGVNGEGFRYWYRILGDKGDGVKADPLLYFEIVLVTAICCIPVAFMVHGLWNYWTK